MKLSRPTVCVCRPIQTSFSPSRVCSASFGVSNWWLHRRAVPARVLASFRSVCSQIERKSERIRVPVLATVQPVLLKTSDHRIVTQFLSLGSAWSLKAALLSRRSPDDPDKSSISLHRDVARTAVEEVVRTVSVALSSLSRSNRGCLSENLYVVRWKSEIRWVQLTRYRLILGYVTSSNPRCNVP